MLGSHRHPPILGGCPYSSERKAILHIRLSMAVVFAIAVNAEEANGSGSAVQRCGLCTVEAARAQCGDSISTLPRRHRSGYPFCAGLLRGRCLRRHLRCQNRALCEYLQRKCVIHHFIISSFHHLGIME